MYTPASHLVHASELGAHAYCARAHWLSKTMNAPKSAAHEARLTAGVQAHETHATTAHVAERATSWATTLAMLAAVALLLFVLLGAGYPGRTYSLTPTTIGIIVLGAGAACAALVAQAARARTQIPAGTRIVATDAGPTKGPYLIDHSIGLAGRPDYIVREGKHLVALEAKPTRRSKRLYEGDRLQAIAYAMLLQHAEPQAAAPYARVSYASRSFVVPLDDKARAECLRVMNEIRRNRTLADVPCSHTTPARCRGCDFRATCTQSLA